MKSILNIKEVQVLSKTEQSNIVAGGGFGPCSQTSDCGTPDCWVCVPFTFGGKCLLLNSCPSFD
ncbi:hypothetical protein KORDIASMS9_02596 [Kordia sp. SMS9]|uniref:hypothetical protein n=1 Tax=Kordia sp. SMS9 TaxID=2282170 RepID=UPI000E0D9EAE|nr:hypothetical protein [Kordia sp. SMS9]AXG70357.1 hypothetical protein KORDIASMS9_02596 [Kordia sp. SMS9]